MRATAVVKQTSDQLIASMETGDNYPAHNRPIVGWLLVSILGSREIPFPGSRKKMGDSRLSSPVNIPTSRCRIIHVLTCRPTAISA